MGAERSFDVRSVMDVIYGENSTNKCSMFVRGSEGKRKAQECEVIRDTKDDKNYTTFWEKENK